jgi:DNA-directed RNA polymerase specialized sigma24 family protein
MEPDRSLLSRMDPWRPDFRPPAGAASFALEELCRDYWFRLYAFVRRNGLSPDAAEDIVQGFLADLLERGAPAGLDQSNGRFRSFLRAACEH